MRRLRTTRVVRGRPAQVKGSLGGNAGGGVPIPTPTKRITGVAGTGGVGTLTTSST